MPVVQQGSINTTALIVPDAYIQIVPPQVTLLNGNPTNILGVVGTASWGPVNAPVVVSDMADYARQFGSLKNRVYDAGTQVAAAVLQGGNNMRVVRVTDGSDLQASVVINDAAAGTGVTVTSKYTGSLANADSVTISNGSASGSYKVTIARPGVMPEVFDNLSGTGNALWVNMANAINNGQDPMRGPSELVKATAGTGTGTPVVDTANPLAGGADGASSIVPATHLVGVDTIPRQGMYALRNTGASVAFLADCDDTSTFADQVAFGLSEGIYMVGVTPAGDTIGDGLTSGAVFNKKQAGIDSYAFKYLFGDWVMWLDTVNGVTRLISPQGFVAGLLVNLSPEQSSLNKRLYGIVGTQASAANLQYSDAELETLGQAGIDVITNPVPGGSYFGVRFGHNSSSNLATNGDNYTRMTNYIAYTLSAGLGQFVGKLQSKQAQDPTRRSAKATLDAFFENMRTPNSLTGYGMIDDFTVQLDKNNNSDSRIALGYMQADVKVVYLSVVEKFLVNMEGGQSVSIVRQSVQLA